MTIDIDVIEAHRQAGNNISNLCNDFLACYFEDNGKNLLKAKKKAVKNVQKMLKNVQKTAVFEQNIYTILVEAKKKRRLGQEFKYLIDQAEQESGISRAEIVAQMEKLP